MYEMQLNYNQYVGVASEGTLFHFVEDSDLANLKERIFWQ